MFCKKCLICLILLGFLNFLYSLYFLQQIFFFLIFLFNESSLVLFYDFILCHPLSRLLIFLVVPFNKIPLFSKDLITFISFLSVIVSVFTESISLLPKVLNPTFTTAFLSSFTKLAGALFANYFTNEFFIDSGVEITNELATESIFEGIAKVVIGE